MFRRHLGIVERRKGHRSLIDHRREWGIESWCRRHAEASAAFVAALRGPVVDRTALTARLQVQLQATVVAEIGTSRIRVPAKKALKRGYERHLGRLRFSLGVNLDSRRQKAGLVRRTLKEIRWKGAS